jgi:integrase
MASVSSDSNGRRKIHFRHPTRGRQTLRLGKVPKSTADGVKVRVERLLSTAIAGLPIDAETACWLASLSNDFHARLARAGLVPHRVPEAATEAPASTLNDFLTKYIEGRAGLRPNTIRNLRQSQRILTEFFGKDRPMESVNAGDADAYKEQLIRDGYSRVTVAREVKRARQVFKAAQRHGLIDTNPFADVSAGGQSNSSRSFYVTREMARAVLDACPDNEWRLIFALSRFGGLRCPSETLGLRWSDVDWEQDRIIVRESKTRARTIPIFPELRPYLETAFEQAEPGAVHVIGRYRSKDANLRTQLLRIVEIAKLEPWPRLFHNLRASRETDLANDYPLHVVCDWIGNSQAVAKKHYLQVTDEHFQKATQKATQLPHALDCIEVHLETQTAVSPAFASDTAVEVPPRGVEPRFSD